MDLFTHGKCYICGRIASVHKVGIHDYCGICDPPPAQTVPAPDPAAEIARLTAERDAALDEAARLREWNALLWTVASAADQHAIVYLGEETPQMRALRNALEPVNKKLAEEAPHDAQ